MKYFVFEKIWKLCEKILWWIDEMWKNDIIKYYRKYFILIVIFNFWKKYE